MAEWLTPSNIMFAIGIIGIIFSVFFYFQKPQIDEQQKAALLAQQVISNNENVERRFADMGGNIKDAMTLAENHIHTVDVKVDKIGDNLNTFSRELVRLSTIIEERIPNPNKPITPAPQMMLK